MIVVNLKVDKYKYDIHSLIKAFYPDKDIKMVLPEEEQVHSDEGQIEIDIDNNEENGSLSMVIKHPEGDNTFMDIKCLKDDFEGSNTDGYIGNEEASLQTPKNAMKQLIYLMLSKETGQTFHGELLRE